MKKKTPNNTRGKQIHLLPVLKVNVQQSCADPDFFSVVGGGGRRIFKFAKGIRSIFSVILLYMKILKKIEFSRRGNGPDPTSPCSLLEIKFLLDPPMAVNECSVQDRHFCIYICDLLLV